jgi:ribulose bisphosphate carboxylase small subunit
MKHPQLNIPTEVFSNQTDLSRFKTAKEIRDLLDQIYRKNANDESPRIKLQKCLFDIWTSLHMDNATCGSQLWQIMRFLENLDDSILNDANLSQWCKPIKDFIQLQSES